MKKLILMVIVSMLVLSTAITAFAMEQQTETAKNGRYTRLTKIQERIATRQAEIKQKRQEVSDFKAVAQEKNALVKAATEENKALRQINTAARKELAQIYADMKANGITLDASTLEQIANYNQQVRDMTDELKDSKGCIKNYIETNKGSLKSLDYAALESMYAYIAKIHSWRNGKLNEINCILSEMLALVK